MNARLVQGIFDDRNPETRDRWKYPDTACGIPSATRASSSMPWRPGERTACSLSRSICRAGAPRAIRRTSRGTTVLSSRTAHSGPTTWRGSTAFSTVPTSSAWLRSSATSTSDRTSASRAKAPSCAATRLATEWLLDRDYRNVLVEVANECDNARYDHAILKPARDRRAHRAGQNAVTRAADDSPSARASTAGRFRHRRSPPRPTSSCSMATACPTRSASRRWSAGRAPSQAGSPSPSSSTRTITSTSTSPRTTCRRPSRATPRGATSIPVQSDYENGYQCPPVNWGINTDRKKAFFGLLRKMTNDK